MTRAMKQRLLQRVEQLLDAAQTTPQTLDDFEALALDLGNQVAQAILEQSGEQGEQEEPEAHPDARDAPASQEPEPEPLANWPKRYRTASKQCCPGCGGSAWNKGRRTRQIQTLAGVLTLHRAYFYCRRCDTGFCPTDAALDLPQTGVMTRRLQQEVAALSCCLPFEQAMQTLARLRGVRLSPRTAERLCLRTGAEVVQAFNQERAQAALPLAFAPPGPLPPMMPSPEVLYVVADGIQTPMKGGSWREMKIGAVRALFKDGRLQQASRYLSHLGDAATFGGHWEALAISCGSLKAKRLVVLGDGAPWLWNLAQERFPLAVQILDFFHACQYVGQVARDAFEALSEGDAAARAARRWLLERVEEMKQSAWDKVSAALRSVDSVAPESVAEALRYFQNNRSRMDYRRYLSMGLCIGSGLAESSCKRLVTQRLKGSGMHWSERGASVICALRCLLLGGEWEAFTAFWNRLGNRPNPRSQPLALSPLT